MKRERRRNKGQVDWGRAAFGIGAGLVAMLALTGGFSWLIGREILAREHMRIAAGAVLVLGSFLGAVCSGGGEGMAARSLVVAAGLILLLLVVNLAMFDGSLSGLLPGSAAVLGSTAAAVLIRGAGSGKKRRSRRYLKYGHG